MPIIYYYPKNEQIDSFLSNGISLSQNFDKEVSINGYIKRCIVCLLNPKDDIEKFEKEEKVCLKLDIDYSSCYVADGFFIEDGALGPKTIELEKYELGTFKTPVALLTTSVFAEQISTLNKDIDVPVLYDNSRDLFYSKKNARILDEISPKELFYLLNKWKN